MHKIPTLFARDPDTFRVIDQWRPECLWVRDGEGIATEKLDGTNVRVTVHGGQIVTVEKRRHPTKAEKAQGVEPGYVPTSRDDPGDQWIFEAVDAPRFDQHQMAAGLYCCEAVGPKIQGNPLGFDHHWLYFFESGALLLPSLSAGSARSHNQLRGYLLVARSGFNAAVPPEGIVFHRRLSDGTLQMAKIKRKDFGL